MTAVIALAVHSFFLQAALPTTAYGNWRRHLLEGSSLLLLLLIVSIFYVLNSFFKEEVLIMKYTIQDKKIVISKDKVEAKNIAAFQGTDGTRLYLPDG